MLHCLRINGVVPFVRSDELHKAGLPLVIDRYDQAVFVSRDAENDPSTFEDARRPKLRLHFRMGLPRSLEGLGVPCLDRAPRVSVARAALPELPQGPLCDHAHAA